MGRLGPAGRQQVSIHYLHQAGWQCEMRDSLSGTGGKKKTHRGQFDKTEMCKIQLTICDQQSRVSVAEM